MHKALVIKELRETAGIAALAVLAFAFVLIEVTGHSLLPWVQDWELTFNVGFPFVESPRMDWAWLVASAVAIALGLRQSAWELGRDTYHFLLHRPVSRRRIFGTKLLVGFALMFVLFSGMILSYALWAATPGNHDTPFYWSMTLPAWKLWYTIPIGYLGAFLSGIRPGRWFGSRLAPLVTSIAVGTATYFIPWWWLGLILVLVAETIFVVAILEYTERRDY